MATELFLDNTNFDSITDIELDGSQYKYRIYWHELYDRWYLDLLDVTGAPLLTGKKRTINSPAFRHRVLEGLFTVISTDLSDDSPAKLTDLGHRMKLYYFTRDEVENAPRRRHPVYQFNSFYSASHVEAT